MQKVTQARNAIGPLLDQLIAQLEAEGSATQKAHFSRIRGRIYSATEAYELKDPIIDLSASVAMGFRFSSTADALVHRILQKTRTLTDELNDPPPGLH